MQTAHNITNHVTLALSGKLILQILYHGIAAQVLKFISLGQLHTVICRHNPGNCWYTGLGSKYGQCSPSLIYSLHRQTTHRFGL